MLEKMDVFFENRLAGYDEHMRTEIEGAGTFYAYTAALPLREGCRLLDLGCGTGLELERQYFEDLRQLKAQENLPEDLYHYDTPLTVEHETELLRKAGFSDVTVIKCWDTTHTVRARIYECGDSISLHS